MVKGKDRGNRGHPQYLAFQGLHSSGIGTAGFVVMALQMQHTMHNHVGVVGFRRLALLLRLALDHLAAQHQVAANASPAS
jgi:hypothetical protein